MKSIKILCSLLLVLMVCSAFSLKGSKGKSVYIVGVSASFTDSLVYFTEIQLLDSVRLDKNKMLPERSQYSYQLKNYLETRKGWRTALALFISRTAERNCRRPSIRWRSSIKKERPCWFAKWTPMHSSSRNRKSDPFLMKKILFIFLTACFFFSCEKETIVIPQQHAGRTVLAFLFGRITAWIPICVIIFGRWCRGFRLWRIRLLCWYIGMVRLRISVGRSLVSLICD